MSIKSIFPAVLLLTMGFHVYAADVSAGKKKSQMCQGCHGINGNSKNPMWPILAGQSASYIEKQLKNFKSGKRKGAVMNNMAASLSDSDIKNLAEFFATQKGDPAGGDPELAKKGKEKVTMCLGCHGNQAQGRGQFPKLAGQHPKYLAKQLTAFKEGTRQGGPMNAIAKNLSDQDIKEISAYLGSL